MGKEDEETPTETTSIEKAFYLGSSDGPGNIITPVKLKGNENYDEWARLVKRALMSKRKFGFIDGRIVEPPETEPEKLEDWIAVSSMLVSWITNTLDPTIRSTVEDYDDAKALWDHLKSRYCVVNGTRICQIKSALGSCTQHPSESISEYFGRVSKIWKALAA